MNLNDITRPSTAMGGLIAQLQEIDRQISERVSEERPEALQQIVMLMDLYHFTLNDIKAATAKVVDPATGKSWNGRGPKPGWVRALEAKQSDQAPDVTPPTPIAPPTE